MSRSRVPAVVTVALVVGAFAFGVAVRPATGDPPAQARSLVDGVYTTEQAERGAEIYRERCSECHQPDQYKGYLARWTGLPVSFFYEIVSSTMPQNNPGSLDRDDYTDVLTYIFSINGAPTGEDELGSDVETLDAITIAIAPGQVPRP